MPLRPIGGKIDLPVATAGDVQSVFEFGVSLDDLSLAQTQYTWYQRDLADYLFYIGAIFPEHFQPFQEALVMLPDPQLRHFGFCTFETWLHLLRGAPDACVDVLMRRLESSSTPSDLLTLILASILAGICTPAALQALAEYAKQSGTTDDVANTGFWIPSDNSPAVPRFIPKRQAAKLQPFEGSVEELLRFPHPVGLPVAAVMGDPDQQLVTWHYCSFQLDEIADLPRLSVARLHLVSPPLIYEWTLYCNFVAGGRYTHPLLSPRTQMDTEDERRQRSTAIAQQEGGRGELALLPFDNHLVYTNSHVHETPGVQGVVGGPPLGIYPNPSCPSCGKLMFHIATLKDEVRSYGDGVRSLFVCEDCECIACNATSWN